MKHLPRAIAATILLLLSANLFACLNLYVINESGKEGMYEHYPPYRIRMSPQSDIQSLLFYEGEIKGGKVKDDHRYISNYAVYLVKLGRNKEALSIFKKQVQLRPGEYELLSNLATAYELNGYPDSALKYMKQSLKINPGSHQWSEWFHLRILEATIQHRDQKTSIGEINIMKVDTASSPRIARIGYEISHQLEERVPLTSAPNDMLSKVLEESADYFKNKISIDWSAKLYAMAIGFSGNEKSTSRLWEKLEKVRAKVVEINRNNSKGAKRDEVRKQLISSKWKSYMQADIDKWKAHKAHFESNISILDL